MSDDSISDSGSEYLPDLSDDYSDSGDSCLEDDSDTEYLEDIEPIVDEDPNWNGYSWNFEVYYGKDTSFSLPDPVAANLSISEIIVVHLMKNLLDKGRHVVTDNWYTSYRLGNYLLTRDTTLTGVVRAGRGPPKKLVNEKLSRHQSTFARRGNTLVVKYMDKKEVNVLTTLYTAGMVEKCKTYFGDKTVFYNKPLHIEKYNSLMGSIDMADQLLEPYAFGKKSLAWFKKLGIHFIFRILLNSYLAYKNQKCYKKDFMAFILEVSKGLVFRHSPSGRAMLEAEEEAKSQKPTKMPNMDVIHSWVRFQPKKQKKCRICTRDFKKRKDTTYHCPGCPGEPGLCSKEHFIAWHSHPHKKRGSEAPRAGSSRQ
ncbi:piggyBac transposable element-derived protein 4-like [Macrobrachium rosenbergii]|uniref:piggyBac transposable element-derived protein 4-like n=1 Tax=Macrobrachium rosenbergii TaxID=79674 RepID=UPI0034D59356